MKEKAEEHPKMLPCIVFIGLSKLPSFRPYLPELLNFMMEWEEKEFKDKKLECLDESWLRLISILGEEFEPYFQKICPRVLQTAGETLVVNWDKDFDVEGTEELLDGSGYASTAQISLKNVAMGLLMIFMDQFTNQIEPVLPVIYQIGRNAMDCPVTDICSSGIALIINVGKCFKTLYGENFEQLMILFVGVFQKLVDLNCAEFFPAFDVLIGNFSEVCRKKFINLFNY